MDTWNLYIYPHLGRLAFHCWTERTRGPPPASPAPPRAADCAATVLRHSCKATATSSMARAQLFLQCLCSLRTWQTKSMVQRAKHQPVQVGGTMLLCTAVLCGSSWSNVAEFNRVSTVVAVAASCDEEKVHTASSNCGPEIISKVVMWNELGGSSP